MESVYGEGYLSPGGHTEVCNTVRGLDIENSEVLDVGCGLGGPAIALIRELGARRVTAIDIEQKVLDRAQSLVEKEKLQDRIELRLVEPGPLPFSDHSFDFVYMNSVSCHIRDLVTFFMEPYRVLKPNAYLVGSEWFKGDDQKAYRQWDELLRERGLNFYFVPQSEFRRTLEYCGFGDVTITDRSEAINQLAQDIVRNVCGPLKDQLVDSLGDATYQSFVDWTKARALGLEKKGSHHCHFRAQKHLPDSG